MLISTPQLILDWSEVWALLIPIIILFLKHGQPPFLKPIIWYLWLAFALNLIGDIIGDFYKHFPVWLQSNNVLYNIHSVVRFICFSYFFYALKQDYFASIKKAIPYFSLVFIIINFGFYENFYNPQQLSGNLLTVESYLLLIYCMLFYLSELKSEQEVLTSGKAFWIVTGLSIYVVINFFVFLFYNPMVDENPKLAVRMWNVHNIAYIILCIFIAKAFYVPANTEYRR